MVKKSGDTREQGLALVAVAKSSELGHASMDIFARYEDDLAG